MTPTNTAIASDEIATLADCRRVAVALQKIDSAIILAHERPDGDALGSSLAMARILKALGKKVALTGIDPLPNVYNFLFAPGEISASSPEMLKTYSALIALDAGDSQRLAAFVGQDFSNLTVFNIDHHATNDRFGDEVWIDGEISSAGEMICHLLKELPVKLTRQIAEPLWLAITSDTGGFNYSNTSPRTLRIAADLLATGIDCHKVHREVRERRQIKDVLLMRRALERLELLADGKIGMITLSGDDFAEFSAGPHSLQEGVNLALMIDGVQLAAFIYELRSENKIKVSLRSYPPYDVSKLCQQFGGGGHARAAGCSFKELNLADVRGRIVAALTKLLRIG